MNETRNLNESTDLTPTAPDAAPRRTRTLLIGGAALVVAAALAGGGIAVGSAVAEEDDDRETSQYDRLDDEDADDRGGSSPEGAPAATGAASAAELADIIANASAHTDGEPVGIEAVRGGAWDVDFETAAGAESEVRVHADGTATVVSTEIADVDDRVSSEHLDGPTLDALAESALARVSGTILEVSIDDDPLTSYEVTVLDEGRRAVELTLGADFAILASDSDSD